MICRASLVLYDSIVYHVRRCSIEWIYAVAMTNSHTQHNIYWAFYHPENDYFKNDLENQNEQWMDLKSITYVCTIYLPFNLTDTLSQTVHYSSIWIAIAMGEKREMLKRNDCYFAFRFLRLREMMMMMMLMGDGERRCRPNRFLFSVKKKQIVLYIFWLHNTSPRRQRKREREHCQSA